MCLAAEIRLWNESLVLSKEERDSSRRISKQGELTIQ